MRLGIAVGDQWGFFHEIYADLQMHYQTHLFTHRPLQSGPFHSRINEFTLQRKMASFLAASDVALFEWASQLLVTASHQPKRCGIVTRLHRYELYKWADLINWDVVDRVILVSQAKQTEFCRRFPAHAAKTMVASPGISLDKFRLVPKPFGGNIGILCHLTPRKRVYDLILAFADIAGQDARLHLHIGGDEAPGHADYYQSLHYIIQRLGLADRVTFYGYVRDAWNWYRNIDIVVSMSYSEGLQVTPMEAMACGCYTLAHYWDGADELVPAANLFLSDHELQQKLLAYCALPEAAKLEQAHTLRAWASERFDVRDTISRFHQAVDCAALAWQQADR